MLKIERTYAHVNTNWQHQDHFTSATKTSERQRQREREIERWNEIKGVGVGENKATDVVLKSYNRDILKKNKRFGHISICKWSHVCLYLLLYGVYWSYYLTCDLHID